MIDNCINPNYSVGLFLSLIRWKSGIISVMNLKKNVFVILFLAISMMFCSVVNAENKINASTSTIKNIGVVAINYQNFISEQYFATDGQLNNSTYIRTETRIPLELGYHIAPWAYYSLTLPYVLRNIRDKNTGTEKSGAGIGDAKLSAKYVLFDEPSLCTNVSISIILPTGKTVLQSTTSINELSISGPLYGTGNIASFYGGSINLSFAVDIKYNFSPVFGLYSLLEYIIAVQISCHTRESGYPMPIITPTIDSRLRGNDIISNSNLQRCFSSYDAVQIGHE